MAKKVSGGMEYKDAPPSVGVPDKVQAVEPVEVPKDDPVDNPIASLSLSLPVSEVSGGYEVRRIDVAALTGKQRSALRRLTNGLISAGAKLENGKEVSRPQDVIKWVLESI